MVDYETKANTFYLNFLIPVRSNFEIFANTFYYSGLASAANVDIDSSNLVKQPGGMDYDLFNQAIPGLSNLDISRFGQAFGFSYRFNDMVMLNLMGEYDDYMDNDPYLFSVDGRRFFIQTGVALLF